MTRIIILTYNVMACLISESDACIIIIINMKFTECFLRVGKGGEDMLMYKTSKVQWRIQDL